MSETHETFNAKSETPTNAPFDITTFRLDQLRAAEYDARAALSVAMNATEPNSPARHAVVKLFAAHVRVESYLRSLLPKRIQKAANAIAERKLTALPRSPIETADVVAIAAERHL